MKTLFAIVMTLGLGCGGDPPPGVGDGGPDDGATADSGPPPAVTSTYTGEDLPEDGFCDARGDVVDIDSLPVTHALDSVESRLDHARPSLGCSVGVASTVQDLVYRFTPPSAGVFTMSMTVPEGSWLDPVFYVRSDCAGGGEELGCSDDESVGSRLARLSVSVEGGVPVYAIVDGVSATDAGPLELTMDFIPLPTDSGPGGETCAEATELSFVGEAPSRIAIGRGDTSAASNDGGCDGVPETLRLGDHYYGFTLEERRVVTILVTPSDMWDVVINVLSACGAPGSVACSDTRPPGQEERVTTDVLPAGRYFIGIDAFAQPISVPEWESGPYEIQVIATLPMDAP